MEAGTAVNLVQAYRQFAIWLLCLVQQLLRVRPRTTLLVIAGLALSDIMRLAAAFLPLKIILLAGSAGIPHYLSFIAPETKPLWIGVSTVAAFAAYGLTLLLESLAEQHARLAGIDVLHRANDLSLHAAEEEEAAKAFSNLARLVASAVVVLLALPVLLWLNPATVGALLILVVSWLALPAWASAATTARAAALRDWFSRQYRQYLTIAVTLSFLGVFLVILIPFLIGGGGNIALVMLVNIVVRQVLSNLAAVARGALTLWPELPRIEAMFFARAYDRGNLRRQQKDAARFAVERASLYRQSCAALAVPADAGSLTMHWRDTVLNGIWTYTLSTTAADQPAQHYQLQVFAADRRDQPANEDVLFRAVERKQLAAAPLIADFSAGDLQCRIYGNGAAVAPPQWSAVRQGLVRRMLAWQPDAALVHSYTGSRPLLPDRLDEAFCRRTAVALDTDEDAQLLADWLAVLPQLRQQLREQPPALFNPDLVRDAVVITADGPLVLHWGRWRFEPFGAVLELAGRASHAAAELAAVQPLRADLAGRSWAGDLELAAICLRLERAIEREQYREALELMRAVLAVRVPQPSPAADLPHLGKIRRIPNVSGAVGGSRHTTRRRQRCRRTPRRFVQTR